MPFNKKKSYDLLKSNKKSSINRGSYTKKQIQIAITPCTDQLKV